MTKTFLDAFANYGEIPQETKEEIQAPPAQPSFLETLLMLSVFELKVEISNCLHALVNNVMLVRQQTYLRLLTEC
jgi:hypothetical protein